MQPEDSRRAAHVMNNTTLFDGGEYTDADLESKETFEARLARDARLQSRADALSAALRKVARIDDLPPDMLALFLEAEKAVPPEGKS